MKDIKLSNIQKESERIKLKKNINDNEDRKAQILLEMGIMTFNKIRRSEIIDGDFNEMCEEIKNIDISIYTDYMKLRTFEKNNRITCVCGYVAHKNEKFCPQCGSNLEIKEDPYIICENCNEKTTIDSNFCGCCGYKINREEILDDEYIEETSCHIDEDIQIEESNYEEFEDEEDDYIFEEQPIEQEGREFLKDKEDK